MGNDSSHSNREHDGGHFLLACRVEFRPVLGYHGGMVTCLELVRQTWNDFCEAMRRRHSGRGPSSGNTSIYREMWGLVTVGYVVVLVRLGKSLSLTKGLRSLRITTCLSE